jgi:hypothetical protein
MRPSLRLLAPSLLLLLAACNTAPSAPTVSIGPVDPRTDDDLVAVVTGGDDEQGDDVSFTYAWTQDGLPREDLTTATVPASETTKGEVWAVTVTPNDGQGDGEAGTASTTILNTAPVAEVAFSPAAPTTDDDVVAVPTGTDADGDTVTFSYTWTVNGAADDSAGDTITADRTEHGQRWAVSVTPSDAEEAGTPVVGEVEIGNSAPVMLSVTLMPDAPFVTDEVVAVVEAADADADPISYTYSWFVDGVEVQQGESDSLAAGSFAKHQLVSVAVTPNDGLVDGESMFSADATVLNSIPFATGASITPAPAYEASTLTCLHAGFADADADAEGWTFSWSVNSTPVATSATIDGVLFSRGDVVSCTATPFDGEESGAPVSSPALNISNTAPVLASVDLSTTTPTETDSLSALLGVGTDDDGDAILYGYEWYVNGTVVSTSLTLSSNMFAKGDSIQAVVTPWDGIESGAPVSSPVATGTNTPPTVTQVTISPKDAFTGDTLTAMVNSMDVDGDAITYTYDWYVDGVPSGSASSSTLDGDLYFDRDQVVTVTATADDGADVSAPLTSSDVTVKNSVPTSLAVAITPSMPEAGDDLTCSVTVPSTDDDPGDTISYTFEWDVDGVAYTAATDSGTTSVVDGADVLGGEAWTCEVVAGDGTDESGPASSRVATCTLGSLELCAASSCEAILADQPSAPDGAYWVDATGTNATEVYCDMTDGGWTLVANIYDSANDDAPNAGLYVSTGWQQTGSGTWSSPASSVLQDYSGTGSAAVSLGFVAALKTIGGQTNLKMCFTHRDGYETDFRSSADGSLTLTSYSTGNAVLTAYSGNTLTYTYGRLAGLAGSNTSYTPTSWTEAGYPIYVTAGASADLMFGGTGQLIDKNNPACTPADGVWHGSGDGISYKPYLTADEELSMGMSTCSTNTANPSASSYGFRLYVGP